MANTTALREIKGHTHPMKQRSIENVFASIWGFIKPPSYEEAPKLVNQGATMRERTNYL